MVFSALIIGAFLAWFVLVAWVLFDIRQTLHDVRALLAGQAATRRTADRPG